MAYERLESLIQINLKKCSSVSAYEGYHGTWGVLYPEKSKKKGVAFFCCLRIVENIIIPIRSDQFQLRVPGNKRLRVAC